MIDPESVWASMGVIRCMEDPYKDDIISGLKESLWKLGVSQVEMANEDSYNNAGKLPFKPDLFFGYNGQKVALFLVNNTSGGTHGYVNGELNLKFRTLENQNSNI